MKMNELEENLETILSAESSAKEVVSSMRWVKWCVAQDHLTYLEKTLEHGKGLIARCKKLLDNLSALSKEEKIIFWQFLHNLCVGNVEFIQEVWKGLKEELKSATSGYKLEGDERGFNVTSAILFQVLKRAHSVVDHEDSSPLLKLMLSAVSSFQGTEDCTFPLLCLKELVLNENLVVFSLDTKSYEDLDSLCKFVLLDTLAEEKELESFPAYLVGFLVQLFNVKCNVLLTALSIRQDVDPAEVVKILHLVCCTSHLDEFRRLQQGNKSLLINAVYLLKMIHDAGKQGSAMFSQVRSLTKLSDREAMESQPAFGLKRDLIRLIGNLCYENVANQDQVREINGIELLLDCSTIDGKNPFITQWVVFAIRSICLGNRRSQSVLNSISNDGQVDKKMLSEIGVRLEGV